MSARKEHIAAAGQIVGNVDHWTTEYSWDGTRWPTREAAIRHGFEVFGCDDFSTAVLVGDEVVWKGWMHEEHADAADRQSLATSLGLSWRESNSDGSGSLLPTGDETP